MSEKARVLMSIAVETAGTVHDRMMQLQGGWTLRTTFDRPAAQFLPPELAEKIGMPLKSGDIIRCRTNPRHRWGISELVERTGHSEWVLREIGSGALCNMGNESVEVLRFMPEHLLYTGVKHRLYWWARVKAFSERYNPKADYFKRCGGVRFEGDKLVVWSRPHVWMQAGDKNGAYLQPRRMELSWSNRTRLKDIVAAMIEQGFAEEFERGDKEPTEGMGGCATFTRDDVLAMFGGKLATEGPGRAR